MVLLYNVGGMSATGDKADMRLEGFEPTTLGSEDEDCSSLIVPCGLLFQFPSLLNNPFDTKGKGVIA
jgi:hypothetical protein